MEPIERSVHCVKLNSTAGDEKPPLKYLLVPNAPESLKIGRQNTPKTSNKITDGFFDSRVLSRNHAEMFIKDSQLFIRDLKSSNGTFLNNEKLSPLQDYPLKVGDKIDLGTTLESQMAHKKITCIVAAVDFISLESYNHSVGTILDMGDLQSKKLELFNTPLDAILFGEIVDDSLLDLLDGDNEKLNAGNGVLINQLVLALSNEHIQQQKLKAMAKFIKNYNNTLVAAQTPQIWSCLDSEVKDLSQKVRETSSALEDSIAHVDEKESVIKKMESTISRLETQSEKYDIQPVDNNKEINDSNTGKNYLVFWGIAIGLIGGASINYFIS